jgi:hypothetical protein
MLPDALGYAWPILFAGAVLANFRHRMSLLAIASAMLFLIPVGLFTNLYLVHDYYATANAIFACAAAAFLIAGIGTKRPSAAVIMTLALIGGMLLRIYWVEWPNATQNLTGHPYLRAGELVREKTPEGTTLIALGVDWSSEVHYYAQRKGIALPGWATLEQVKQIAGNPDRFMGGLPIAAVADCRQPGAYMPEANALLDEFVARFASHAKRLQADGGCAVYIRELK